MAERIDGATFMAETMTERQLQVHVESALRIFGWRYYHTRDSRRSVAGFPDLTAVRGGRLLFIELKSAKGKLSADQRAWITDLAFTFADIYEWRPCCWNSGEIEAVLK